MNKIDKQNRALLQIFTDISRRIRRRQLVYLCITTLGLAAVIALLFGVIDQVATVREGHALIIVGILSIALGFYFIANLLRILFRSHKPAELALAVENAYPEFLDELICAVEIEEAKSRPNALEQALVEKVYARTKNFDFNDTVIPKMLQWKWLLGTSLLFAALFALSINSQFISKAVYHLTDLLRSEATGLTIVPGNRETPIHSDVRVKVTVERWQNQAVILYQDSTGRHRYPMNPADDSEHFFTFYDLTESVQYRIITPSLGSRWYKINVFEPPRIDVAAFELTPPAYTGRDIQSYTALQDASTVSGSDIVLKIRTEAGNSVRFSVGEEDVTVVANDDGDAEHNFLLDHDVVLQVQVRNPQERSAQTPEFNVIAEPDLPPIVDVIRPVRDVKAKPETTVAVEARAGDDFGVTEIRLVYSVSGMQRQSLVLFAAAPNDKNEGVQRILDKTAQHALDLAALDAEAGDVISAFFLVKDNREPDAQTARSEIFFIEVRPEIKPDESDAPGQDQQEMEVASLIAELKRLIRMTWDAQNAVAERRQELQKDLLRNMRDLKIETRKKYNEMKTSAGGAAGGALFQLMEEAENEIAKAESLIERDLLDESLPPQERALARLITLENELMKNAAKSGQGQEQKDDVSQQEQKQQQKEQSASQQEQLALIKKLLEKMRRLAASQENFNESLAKRLGAESNDLHAAMAERQDELRRELKEIQAQMQEAGNLQRSWRDSERAGVEMEQGVKRIEKGDVKGGHQHGKRSSNFLSAAMQSLEEEYRQAAAKRIGALTQAAQQLSDEQRAAAQVSRELPGQAQENVEAARKNQSALNEKGKSLQQAIRRTTEEFEEMFPEVAKSLGEAASLAQKENIEGKMSRSTNALLYRQYEKAAQSQTDAANALQLLSSALKEAGRRLPALSREELLQALNSMRRKMQQAQQAGQKDDAAAEEELERIRQNASQEMDALASALQDEQLQQIGDELALPSGESSAAAASQRLISLFQAASAVLEQHLSIAELRRRFILSRRSSEPPAEFKRLVEQYFKDLSETP